MKIIAITSPKVVDEDAYLISYLLAKGVDNIHLRKPLSDVCECRILLRKLTDEQRSRIIIHNYPELYEEFSLKGIHVNRRVKTLPKDYDGLRTRSCHTMEEVERYKAEYDYLFLSPIFDSISKVGYLSGFSERELQSASESGIIDKQVIALGGVTFEKIPYLKMLNFGGVAMIGAIYNMNILDKLRDIDAYR